MSELVLHGVLVSTALAAALGWMALRRLLAAVPAEDRRWRDQPPAVWRIGWPLVRLGGVLVAPLIPRRLHGVLSRLLRQAGLDLALEPQQVLGAMLVAAAGGVAASYALTAVLLRGSPFVSVAAFTPALLAGGLAAIAPLASLRARREARQRAIGRALPFYLDLITLSVESGANLTGAIRHAVAKGPPGPLRVELDRVVRDVAAGRGRAEALRVLAQRLELAAVSSWVAALITAERHGTALGPILRAQAEQRRQERFQRAEKLAMRAPVKMLFPLLVFIFPCTFVLLAFPVVVRLLEEGILR